MDVHAKLEWPEGKDLNPSRRCSVLVHTVHEVRPYSGFWIPGGRPQRAKRSGRGRPVVIWC